MSVRQAWSCDELLPGEHVGYASTSTAAVTLLLAASTFGGRYAAIELLVRDGEIELRVESRWGSGR